VQNLVGTDLAVTVLHMHENRVMMWIILINRFLSIYPLFFFVWVIGHSFRPILTELIFI